MMDGELQIHFLLAQDRPSGGINHHKAVYAKDFQHMTDLAEISRAVKPTAAIG